MFSLLIVLSQWFFKGCIITRAEQILTGSTETIVDPLLRCLMIKPTKDTRIAITVGCSMTVFFIMLFSICLDTFM